MQTVELLEWANVTEVETFWEAIKYRQGNKQTVNNSDKCADMHNGCKTQQ